MDNFIKYLDAHGIRYTWEKYGNGQYFADGFAVSAVHVIFGDYDNDAAKMADFEKSLKRRKGLFFNYSYSYGDNVYKILTKADNNALLYHCAMVRDCQNHFAKLQHENGAAVAVSWFKSFIAA